MKRDFWKSLFYYSKSDRRALWLLCVLLVAGSCFYTGYLLSEKRLTRQMSEEEQKWHTVQKEMLETKQREYWKQHNKGEYGDIPTAETFPFDPNTAEAATFERLGLPHFIIKNIYKYRSKGGYFHTPEDFARIYGLKKETFQRLRPYIRIAPQALAYTDSMHKKWKSERTARRDSFLRQKPEKYPDGVTLNLNTADTTELKKLHGIGSYYARRIVRYREQLGGYTSVNQLHEIDIPEELHRCFTLAKEPVRALKINKASFSTILRHPYLNYRQTQAIFEHKRKYGTIKELVQLKMYTVFTENDLRRLEPYLDLSE